MLPPLLRALCCGLIAAGCSSSVQDDDEAAGAAPSRAAAVPRRAEGEVMEPAPAAPEAPLGGAPAAPPSPQAPVDSPSPAGPNDALCERSRFVLRPDVSNARDLGGVPLANGAVTCGTVFRGPPLHLSAQGCEQLASLGIKTVIDLRTDGERLGSPQSACVTSALVAAPLPVPYGLGPADYLRDLNTDESVAKVFHTFGDPDAYPIYFHCTYGRDRTGVIGALLLLTLGASRQTVMEEYLLSAPNVGAYPNALEAVLDDVEARGGPERLLSELGVTSEEIAVLRERAISR